MRCNLSRSAHLEKASLALTRLFFPQCILLQRRWLEGVQTQWISLFLKYLFKSQIKEYAKKKNNVCCSKEAGEQVHTHWQHVTHFTSHVHTFCNMTHNHGLAESVWISCPVNNSLSGALFVNFVRVSPQSPALTHSPSVLMAEPHKSKAASARVRWRRPPCSSNIASLQANW